MPGGRATSGASGKDAKNRFILVTSPRPYGRKPSRAWPIRASGEASLRSLEQFGEVLARRSFTETDQL
jgi:hypothetical protein